MNVTNGSATAVNIGFEEVSAKIAQTSKKPNFGNAKKLYTASTLVSLYEKRNCCEAILLTYVLL